LVDVDGPSELIFLFCSSFLSSDLSLSSILLSLSCRFCLPRLLRSLSCWVFCSSLEFLGYYYYCLWTDLGWVVFISGMYSQPETAYHFYTEDPIVELGGLPIFIIYLTALSYMS
jgi:hypothetical protein